MKFIGLIRHGDFDTEAGVDYLNLSGKEQLTSLSELLFKKFSCMNTVIFSSPAARALESAQIVSDKLGVPVKPEEILWSDDKHRKDCQKIMDLIDKNKENEVILLITHMEYMNYFPRFFLEKQFGPQLDLNLQRAEKGAAFIIDCRPDIEQMDRIQHVF
jgi:phosphohistidine phosphatase SixA